MKKLLFSVVLAFAVLVTLAGSSFAADVTPVKLSLLPGIGIPEAQIVHGLDLGILGSAVDEVSAKCSCPVAVVTHPDAVLKGES